MPHELLTTPYSSPHSLHKQFKARYSIYSTNDLIPRTPTSCSIHRAQSFQPRFPNFPLYPPLRRPSTLLSNFLSTCHKFFKTFTYLENTSVSPALSFNPASPPSPSQPISDSAEQNGSFSRFHSAHSIEAASRQKESDHLVVSRKEIRRLVSIHGESSPRVNQRARAPLWKTAEFCLFDPEGKPVARIRAAHWPRDRRIFVGFSIERWSSVPLDSFPPACPLFGDYLAARSEDSSFPSRPRPSVPSFEDSSVSAPRATLDR